MKNFKMNNFKLTNIAIVFALIVGVWAIHAIAQTATPAGASCLTFSTSSGLTTVCGLPSDVQISSNGGPFVSLKGKDGQAGPAGAPGLVGATGAAGSSVTLNGKMCSATFTGKTEDGKGGGGLILTLGTCQ